ncbi:hypothetical protein N9E91_04115 [Alphaproteobacteria bacterium]|nr:hypothetical protein [Alphaproteobacteria bacterium]
MLDVKSSSFEEDLLININLLQENTGVHGVFPENTSDSDYLQSIEVHWEILPVGVDDDENNLIKIIGRRKVAIDEQEIRNRYDTIKALEPRNFIKGRSGFQRYFGAQFEDNLVAFENITYGNALYVMFEDWEALSKRSRVDLIKSNAGGYVRIIHRTGWKRSLANVINQYREENAL